jgi:hypothetical protein
MKNLFWLLSMPISIFSFGQNLVPNPQFEIARPSGGGFTFYKPQMETYLAKCNDNLSRLSIAQNWTLWLGTRQPYAGVVVDLVPAASNCVAPWPNFIKGNMMHVKTTVGAAGIVNSDIPGGTKKVRISCWVFVIKGSVVFSYGPTGSGLVNTSTGERCKWVKLTMEYDGSRGPANQITLYGNKADTEFYVDDVVVEELTATIKPATDNIKSGGQVIKQ